MATLGAYTTTEAVRGCLGLDANDMPDAYMVDSLLDVELILDLDSWLPSHATLLTSGTTTEQNLLKLYAQWFCAHEMATRPWSVPQITTDGKAQIDRYKIDWERVAQLAGEKMAKFRSALDVAANAAVPASAGNLTLLGVSVPNNDPVTEGLQ